jgi:hypothetical protein
MKYPIIYPLALLFSYCFILNCKGCKDNPCDSENYLGYEMIDGVCQCPEGKFQVNGYCKALEENEYWGLTTGCDCRDSVFFKAEYGVIDVNGDTIVRLLQRVDSYLVNKLVFDLIETPDGDSLRGRFEIGSRCEILSLPTRSTMNAKFSKDKSTLKVYTYNKSIINVNGSYPQDTCIYQCRR